MNLRNFILLPTAFIFILAACGGAADPTLLPPVEPEVATTSTSADPRAPSDSGAMINAEVGARFQLAVGQRAAINGLVITFVAVSEESRCPQGAQCIWAGRVKVLVWVQKDGVTLGEFELTEGEIREGDVSEMEVGGIVVSLLGVKPYPLAGEPTEEGEYVVEMVVIAST